jgi:hypothetical protein
MEGSGQSVVEELSRYLPGGTEESHDKPLVGMAGVPAEMRTKNVTDA